MSEIQLTIAGSGDAFGSGGKMNTCFHVKTEEYNFLIDCGATSLVALKQRKIYIQKLDYILITHLHGDHFGGLPLIILDAIQNKRTKPLIIVGPQGIEDKTWQLFDLLYPGSAGNISKDNFIFRSYSSFEEIEIGQLHIKAIPVVHAEKSLPHGLRIHLEGKILSYSGDTEWTENLILIAKQADLFICECCYFDAAVKGHLNYITIKEKLPELDCRKILLTHMDQQLLDRVGELNLDYASDGMVIDV